jgi:hypothetical protein
MTAAPMPVMPPVAAVIAARVATGVAAVIALIAARNLLHYAAAYHPAAGDGLAVRDAADNSPARLIRHHLAAHHTAGDLPLARNALVAADLAVDFLDNLLVGADLDADRLALTNGAVAGYRAFFPSRAGHPAAYSLRRHAAAIVAAAVAVVAAAVAVVATAVAAAVAAMAEPAMSIAKVAVIAGHNFAFPMAAVDTAAASLGVGFTPVALLHNGAVFVAGNRAAHLLADGLVLRDPLVLANGVSAFFRIALATIRGVVFLPALAAVHSARRLIRFRNPFSNTDGTVLGRTRGRRSPRCRLLSVIFSPCGQGRRGQDTASQQGNAKMLPHNAFSFIPILADPGGHRDIPLGRTGQPMRFNVTQLCPMWKFWKKKSGLEFEKKVRDLS